MRVFIVDHNCVLSFGHNSRSVKLFTDFFQQDRHTAIGLVPKSYSGEFQSLKRQLHYPYSHLVEPHKPNWLQKRNVNRFVNKTANFLGIDAKLFRLRANWLEVIEEYRINQNDLIFFPSADFFGVMSLLQILNKTDKPDRTPSLHFRFIGVMENNGFRRAYARLELIHMIRSCAEKLRITISAETPNYAQYLQLLTKSNVLYFPYPIFDAGHHATSQQFLISSPGSGRVDKGFFDTLAIAKEVYTRNPEAPITISTQDMNPSDRYYDTEYSQTLSQFPNVQLRSSRLSDAEIHLMMQNSVGYFLPYSPETYRRRGSAIFQEAISYGKSVIAKRGTGFSELVLRYKAGHLAETPVEFAKAIESLYRAFEKGVMPSADRDIYREDLVHAAQAIIGRM